MSNGVNTTVPCAGTIFRVKTWNMASVEAIEEGRITDKTESMNTVLNDRNAHGLIWNLNSKTRSTPLPMPSFIKKHRRASSMPRHHPPATGYQNLVRDAIVGVTFHVEEMMNKTVLKAVKSLHKEADSCLWAVLDSLLERLLTEVAN